MATLVIKNGLKKLLYWNVFVNRVFFGWVRWVGA